MKQLLKQLFQNAIDMINNNEFEDFSRKDLEDFSIIIHRPKTLGREEAAKFLGVSLNKFHELKDKGIIQPPRKIKGFKEKAYYTSDLSKSLQIIDLEKD